MTLFSRTGSSLPNLPIKITVNTKDGWQWSVNGTDPLPDTSPEITDEMIPALASLIRYLKQKKEEDPRLDIKGLVDVWEIDPDYKFGTFANPFHKVIKWSVDGSSGVEDDSDKITDLQVGGLASTIKWVLSKIKDPADLPIKKVVPVSAAGGPIEWQWSVNGEDANEAECTDKMLPGLASLIKWGRKKGDKGDKGKDGKLGEKGEDGPRGLKGDKGDKGDAGAKGDTGSQGPAGAQGPTGAQGPSGGAQGPAGPTGATGAPGAPGRIVGTGAGSGTLFGTLLGAAAGAATGLLGGAIAGGGTTKIYPGIPGARGSTGARGIGGGGPENITLLTKTVKPQQTNVSITSGEIFTHVTKIVKPLQTNVSITSGEIFTHLTKTIKPLRTNISLTTAGEFFTALKTQVTTNVTRKVLPAQVNLFDYITITRTSSLEARVKALEVQVVALGGHL
jgi:hypothetical protein